MTRFFPSLYKMKYVDYLRNAAAQAVQFGGDCANLAGDVIANIPEQAAAVSSAVATYTEMAGAAISAFVQQESFETFNGVVSASSMLAATLGAAVENSPSYLESFAGRVADYITAAEAAASAYLAGKEPTNSMQWVQVQDDGVYVQGYGGTSGGAGSSGEWDKITPPPKYPEAGKIPVVPPEIVPQGEPKIRKIKPMSPASGDCVNKMFPKIGAFIEESQPYFGGERAWLYFDNVYIWRTWYQHFDFERHHEEFFAGTPVMPSLMAFEAFAALPNGRYDIVHVNSNERTYWKFAFAQFYHQKEGWNWELKSAERDPYGHISWPRSEIRSHDDAWLECLGMELPGVTNFYHFPGIIAPDYVSADGEGHYIQFTQGRIEIKPLGDNFPPVEETPEETTPAAYLATLGAIEALNFQNITTILGGIYGSNQNIFRR